MISNLLLNNIKEKYLLTAGCIEINNFLTMKFYLYHCLSALILLALVLLSINSYFSNISNQFFDIVRSC